MSETHMPPRNHPGGLRAAAGWLLMLTALVVGFGYNLREMWPRWFPVWRHTDLSLYDRLVGGESYYTHGPLVPMVSGLILLLLVRHVRVPIRPRPRLGFAVLSASLVLHMMASLARVNFAAAFMIIGVLVGLVLLLWGAEALRTLWFPLVFLAFMVPLPEVSISDINFRLKEWATQYGVWLADKVGIIVERSGSNVFLQGGKQMVVANVCNGLRTLISLLAFGSLYTYVCRLRGGWRALLFAMTVPVAVLSNAVRIVALIAVADLVDVRTATGWFHDTSGVLIFVLAFLLMFGIERLILWARKAVGRPAEVLPLFAGRLRGDQDAWQWSRMSAALGRPRSFVAGGLVLAAGIYSLVLARTVPNRADAEYARKVIPAVLHVGGQDLLGQDIELDEKTLAVLEDPSYLVRRYSAPGNPPVDVSLIFSKDNRKGTHPPDLCLEGGGEGIVAKSDLDLPGVLPGRALPTRELTVLMGGTEMVFLYTYKCGGRYTRSFWTQQMVIFLNGLLQRDATGALVRISTPVRMEIEDPHERAREARERCIEMMGTIVPLLEQELP